MNIVRDPLVYLHPDEPRCQPNSQRCKQQSACARGCACMPSSNAVLADYTLDPVFRTSGWCVKFLSFKTAAKDIPKADTGPRHHKAPEGLA
jgi:hypothetical protein